MGQTRFGVKKITHRDDSQVCARCFQSFQIHRAADPAEIAEAVAFLTSPRASYVTGAIVAADGVAQPCSNNLLPGSIRRRVAWLADVYLRADMSVQNVTSVVGSRTAALLGKDVEKNRGVGWEVEISSETSGLLAGSA